MANANCQLNHGDTDREHPAEREHHCWDHAEPAQPECLDFDYVCRDCGRALRSDSWYRFQE